VPFSRLSRYSDRIGNATLAGAEISDQRNPSDLIRNPVLFSWSSAVFLCLEREK